MNKYRLLAIISVVVLAADQWTKHLIHSKFRWGESLSLIESFFALTYVRNSGAAFGLLNRAPSWFRDPFFIVVPTTALLVILAIYRKVDPKQKWTAVGLSLILSGAVGNLIDRLRFGFVIDFLDFHWKEVYHWPAFNVADSCIVVGVSILFLQSIRAPAPANKSGGLSP